MSLIDIEWVPTEISFGLNENVPSEYDVNKDVPPRVTDMLIVSPDFPFVSGSEYVNVFDA